MQETISIAQLFEIKKKTMRSGIWFKVLDRVERAIISLTIRCLKKIRSSQLARIVTTILAKLISGMKCQAMRLIEKLGYRLACKISRLAAKWGNSQAWRWTKDAAFIQYLAFTEVNVPS